MTVLRQPQTDAATDATAVPLTVECEETEDGVDGRLSEMPKVMLWARDRQAMQEAINAIYGSYAQMAHQELEEGRKGAVMHSLAIDPVSEDGDPSEGWIVRWERIPHFAVHVAAVDDLLAWLHVIRDAARLAMTPLRH